MSAYNVEKYIEESIQAIINQTYQNWEFIICDDASTDKTWEIIKRFKEVYPNRFIIFKNERNYRLAYSLNECLKRATGDYIARMDADDTCSKERFVKQVSYLENNKHVSLVGTDLLQFNSLNYKRIIAEKIPDKKILLRKVPFFHPTILTYPFVYEKVNGYTVKERTKVGQDLDLWFKFYQNGFIGHNINEPLYTYRIALNKVEQGLESNYIFNMFKTRFIGVRKIGLSKLNYVTLIAYLIIDLIYNYSYKWVKKI